MNPASSDTLRERLRSRRKVISDTMQSSTVDKTSASEVTELDTFADSQLDAIPLIGDTEVDEDEDENVLRNALEERRETTRRKLNVSELQQTPISPRTHSRNDIETPRSITSMPPEEMGSTGTFGTRSSTLHRSLKSKYQAKLQAAKQQRDGSDEAMQKARRLRDRMNLSTRFDPMMLGAEQESERDLQKRVLAKLEWKKAINKVKTEMGEPTEEECDDFFTRQFEAEPDEEIQPEATEVGTSPGGVPSGEPPPTDGATTQAVTPQDPSSQEIAEAPGPDTVVQVEDDEDDGKVLLSDVVPPELDWKLFTITAAEYKSYREQVATENLNYFTPSIRPAMMQNKVPDPDKPPRYPEEEGLYVGTMPDVQQRNMNILENRLLREPNGKEWFGMDGRLNTTPDPVKDVVMKPWVEAIEEVDRAIETVYVKAYDDSVEKKYLQGSSELELQVDLGLIQFLHHPLMSPEHVVASNLGELYDAYIRHKHMNYATFYNDKLVNLRTAVVTLKQNINSLNKTGNPDVLASMEKRLQEFVSEVRRSTRQRDLTESHERELMRRIITEWEKIKRMRTAQGFINTSVKLTIKQQEVNMESDKQDWEAEIAQEVNEFEEEYEYTVMEPYRKAMLEYREKLQEWKIAQKRTKAIHKTLNDSKENLLTTDEQTDEGEMTDSVDISTKPIRPTKPDKFNHEQAKVQLGNIALKNRRNPGEAKISLEVANTANVTPNTQVPPGELNRRKAVQKTTMFAKVLFNGRIACQTEAKPLTSDFKVNFGRLFQIRIAQWPESLKIQIYEDGIVSSIFSEVYLHIPDGSVTSENTQLGPTEFSNDKILTYSNEAVGSNTPFKIHNEPTPVVLKTRGQLISSVAWGVNDQGEVLAPKMLCVPRFDALKSRRKQGQNQAAGEFNVGVSEDPEEILRWTQHERVDPNDPVNAGMAGPAKAIGGAVAGFDVFRLDNLQEEFNFTTSEDINNAKRFRILHLRNLEVAEFRNLKMIPSNENEILDSAFTAYERRLKQKDSLGEMGEKRVTAGTLSAHRLEVLRFRQRIRDAVLHRFYTARHQHTLQDMVNEDQVPDVGTLGISLLKIIEPRRPLKPIRKARKKVTTQNLSDGNVSIIVSVARAYNLPIRNPNEPFEHRHLPGTSSNLALVTKQEDKSSDPYQLCPFVSVSFQGNVLATNVAQGPNPSWNEEVEIPFSAPNNDYSIENLQSVDDTIFVHVFDRVIKEKVEDSRDRRETGESSGVTAGTVSHSIQNMWLGSIKLPFSTLYQRGKVEGTFKINVPPVLLGYNAERKETRSDDPYMQMETQFLQPTEGSYLSLFITLDPDLTKPEPVRQKFETQEDESLIRQGLQYEMQCKKRYPQRPVKTTVIDIKGESVFILKYISPIAPPAELLEGFNQDSIMIAQRLARFVSLIPFVSDNVAYAGICDLWSTCDQFMNMLCGDEEEHALLLLNFFLHLGKEAYMVLGNAIPEGETAYVLTFEQTISEYVLWNASTGQYYKTTDNLCPLQTVGSLIDKSNIYFNCQTNEFPARISFNVRDTKSWKPLFTSVAPELMSVQPASLHYVHTDLRYVQTLEEKLTQTLRESIMKWRPRHVTRWNRSCSNVLKEILKSLEAPTWRPQTTAEVRASSVLLGAGSHGNQLSRMIGDAEFTGFPMTMAFTDIPTVIKEVKSTEVYKNQDKDVEFALAVYIHPYPASVLSVWVYIATINNTRRINF